MFVSQFIYCVRTLHLSRLLLYHVRLSHVLINYYYYYYYYYYFSDVLNQPEPVIKINPEEFTCGEDLDVDTQPITKTEVEKAISRLKNGKSAGIDQIQAELLKHGSDNMIESLTNLLNQCWAEEQVPEDWLRGVLVKLPIKEIWLNAKTGEELHYCQCLVKFTAQCS